MVREVTSKTSDAAGDRTTTATVLAVAIVKEGTEAVAAGMNPTDLKRGIGLLRSVEALKHVRTQNEDQKHGVEIVSKAIQTKARQTAINVGEDGSVVVGKIFDEEQYSFGYDA